MSALEAMPTGAYPVVYPQLRLIRRLNGSAQSVLVEDENQRLWVLKPKSDLQGPNALANEFLGSSLCRTLGLPVPDHQIIFVDEGFWMNPCVWMPTGSGDQAMRAGLHFASRYIPDATGKDAFEMVPTTLQSAVRGVPDCLGMFLFDVWAMHADSRQVLFSLEGNGLHPTFFDHSHLFGGPWGLTTKPFVNGRLFQRLALRSYQEDGLHERWVLRMEEVLPFALRNAISMTPPEWFKGDLNYLEQTLLNRLANLRPLVDLAFAAVQCHLRIMCANERVDSRLDLRVLSHRGAVRWA